MISGLHGPVLYSTPVFLGFLIATFLSILDSIGDYYACASMSHVPPPPQHAVNRGIMIEGFGTILSGAVGATQATTTYGGNIGAIGITKARPFKNKCMHCCQNRVWTILLAATLHHRRSLPTHWPCDSCRIDRTCTCALLSPICINTHGVPLFTLYCMFVITLYYTFAVLGPVICRLENQKWRVRTNVYFGKTKPASNVASFLIDT